METLEKDTLNRTVGSLVGLACGDAVGTTVEFSPRGSFKPLTDMTGGGPFDLQAGQWTDDTSMALCLAHSLSFQKAFDPEDQMNRYCNWYRIGYMSSTGSCFDIGITVKNALHSYLANQNPYAGSTAPDTAGNGSIMRLAPIAIFYRNVISDALRYAAMSSQTTHGCEECIESCQLFTAMLINAFKYDDKEQVLRQSVYSPSSEKVIALANLTFLNKTYEELRGSGYVIDSLEAALWCFYHADSYKQSILLAANLGDDADTTAAVCGQIAGAFYGLDGIPRDWVEKITDTDEIQALAKSLTLSGPA